MGAEIRPVREDTLDAARALPQSTGLSGGGPDEQYSPRAVARYRAAVRTGTNPPVKDDPSAKHYSQLVYDWTDGGTVSHLLGQIGVNPSDLIFSVIGGFTGEYTDALSDAGAQVIFTDPHETWVEHARELGHQAYNCTGCSLPPHVLSKSDGVTSFECYHTVTNASTAIYTLLRFSLTPVGFVFVESDRTRTALGGEHTPAETAFDVLTSEFPVSIQTASSEGLHAYRLTVRDDTEATRYARAAVEILSELYDQGRQGITMPVTDRMLDQISSTTGVPVRTVTRVLDTTATAFRRLTPVSIRDAIPAQSFCVGENGYYAPLV